jgi:hypothetical protein
LQSLSRFQLADMHRLTRQIVRLARAIRELGIYVDDIHTWIDNPDPPVSSLSLSDEIRRGNQALRRIREDDSPHYRELDEQLDEIVARRNALAGQCTNADDVLFDPLPRTRTSEPRTTAAEQIEFYVRSLMGYPEDDAHRMRGVTTAHRWSARSPIHTMCCTRDLAIAAVAIKRVHGEHWDVASAVREAVFEHYEQRPPRDTYQAVERHVLNWLRRFHIEEPPQPDPALELTPPAVQRVCGGRLPPREIL